MESLNIFLNNNQKLFKIVKVFFCVSVSLFILVIIVPDSLGTNISDNSHPYLIHMTNRNGTDYTMYYSQYLYWIAWFFRTFASIIYSLTVISGFLFWLFLQAKEK